MTQRVNAQYRKYSMLNYSGNVEDESYECQVWGDYDYTIISSGWKTFGELVENCNEKTIFGLLEDGNDDAIALYRTAKEYGGLYLCDEWVPFDAIEVIMNPPLPPGQHVVSASLMGTRVEAGIATDVAAPLAPFAGTIGQGG